ncbi:MAG: CU044_2847 family protein [Thainema sp.]
MNRLVEYEIGEGQKIIVEVSEPTPGGLVPVGRGSDTIVKAQRTLSDTLDNIRPAAEAIIDKLSDLTKRPDEIAIEFGVKLSANAGAVLAAASAECNFVIHLTWKDSDNE